MNRAALASQLATIVLTALQSFLAPLLFGVSEYGRTMVLLAPVFFAQAIVEPHLQFHFNDRAGELPEIDLPHVVLVSALASIGASIVLFLLDQTVRLDILAGLSLVAFVYVFYTALQSHAFSQGRLDVAAWSLAAATLVYGLVLGLGWFFSIPEPMIVATGAGFLTGVVVSGRYSRRHVSVAFRLSELPTKTALVAICQRLPTTAFTSVTVMVLGAFGAPASLAGEYKIFSSIVNSVRFLNPIPSPMLQVHISRCVKSGLNIWSDSVVRHYFIATICAIAMCAVLGPVAYGLFYGRPSFGFVELVLCSGVILIQPAAYWLMTETSKRRVKTMVAMMPHLVAATVLIAVFAIIQGVAGSPFMASAASSLTALAIYAFSLSLLKPSSASGRRDGG